MTTSKKLVILDTTYLIETIPVSHQSKRNVFSRKETRHFAVQMMESKVGMRTDLDHSMRMITRVPLSVERQLLNFYQPKVHEPFPWTIVQNIDLNNIM